MAGPSHSSTRSMICSNKPSLSPFRMARQQRQRLCAYVWVLRVRLPRDWLHRRTVPLWHRGRDAGCLRVEPPTRRGPPEFSTRPGRSARTRAVAAGNGRSKPGSRRLDRAARNAPGRDSERGWQRFNTPRRAEPRRLSAVQAALLRASIRAPAGAGLHRSYR